VAAVDRRMLPRNRSVASAVLRLSPQNGNVERGVGASLTVGRDLPHVRGNGKPGFGLLPTTDEKRPLMADAGAVIEA